MDSLRGSSNVMRFSKYEMPVWHYYLALASDPSLKTELH